MNIASTKKDLSKCEELIMKILWDSERDAISYLDDKLSHIKNMWLHDNTDEMIDFLLKNHH